MSFDDITSFDLCIDDYLLEKPTPVKVRYVWKVSKDRVHVQEDVVQDRGEIMMENVLQEVLNSKEIQQARAENEKSVSACLYLDLCMPFMYYVQAISLFCASNFFSIVYISLF